MQPAFRNPASYIQEDGYVLAGLNFQTFEREAPLPNMAGILTDIPPVKSKLSVNFSVPPRARKPL
jgi:hypothetical protein